MAGVISVMSKFAAGIAGGCWTFAGGTFAAASFTPGSIGRCAVDGCTFDGTVINSSTKAVPPNYPFCKTGACPGQCFINCQTDSELFSFHAGGINVLFADGHVSFLNDNLDVATLAALLTRNCSDIPGDY